MISGNSTSEQPQTAVFDEAEEWYRDHPADGFQFLPVGVPGYQRGRLVCFRRVVDIPKEVITPSEPAWIEVIWRDRKCPAWSRWVPGISPREQFAEERQRKFTLDIKAIETRLTWLAIGVAIVIGLMQLSLMTPDSAGWKLLAWVFRPFGWLRYW